MKPWFVKLGVLVLAIGLIVFIAGEQTTTPRHKTGDSRALGTVKRGDITVSVTAAGSVASAKSTEILAPYNGYVVGLFIKVGDTVKPGDPLLSIGESAVVQAHEVHPLRAPFKGTVVEVNVNQGEQVLANSQSTPHLLRIEDLSSFHVLAELPELDYVKIHAGLVAKIKVSALIERNFSGSITKINLAAKTQNNWEKNRVTFPIEVAISESDPRLKPGLSALVDIEVASKKGVLLLEHEFIEKSSDSFVVTRADGSKVPVVLGLQNEAVAEIVSGLEEGQQVQQVDFLASGEA